MLKKISITVAIAALTQMAVFAQTTQNSGSLKMARKLYESLKYEPAIEVLTNYLRDKPKNQEAEELLANSYRQIKDYDKAVYWYAELTKETKVKPEWALYYAQALANKQQYQESQKWYNKYMALQTKDRKEAESFVSAYENVDDFFKSRADWKIEYLNINTAGAEYSPIYYKNGLVFVSNRRTKEAVKHVFEWDKTPYSDLYYVDASKIKGIDPDSVMRVLRKEIKASGKKLYKENDDDTSPTANDTRIVGSYNVKILHDTLGEYLAPQVNAQLLSGAIDSKYHEGPAASLPNGSLMFTRNNYIGSKYAESRDGVNKLKIYIASAPGFDKITSFKYNDDQYSVGHPAINSTGLLLIFASDMPGGYGGSDLYYCTRKTTSDEWSKPVNMGPVINTSGNELFPTMYKDELLFSSTGLPGLGGLDIFQVKLDGFTPLHAPINMGAPINSSVDDFGMIRSDDGRTGYFSSNRKGSDDIYRFRNIAFVIKVKGGIIDSLTGKYIDNPAVTIANRSIDAHAGKFDTVLAVKSDYKITAAKPGYVASAINISTQNITKDTTLTVVLALNKIAPKTQIINTITCDSVKKLVAVRKIYYDLNKSFIRPDAHGALDSLIDVLNSHQAFKVTLASHCDARASSAFNDALSMRRSVECRAYLLQHGIKPSRIHIEAYGKSRLVSGCPTGVQCTEAQMQLDRRTEFILVKNGKELQDVDCKVLKTVVAR